MHPSPSRTWLAALLTGAVLIAGCDCGGQPPIGADAGGGGGAEDGGAGGGAGGGAVGGGGGGGGGETDGGAGGGAAGGGAGGGDADGGAGGGAGGGAVGGGGGSLPDAGVTLLTIGVTPADPQLAVATVLQLTATGTWSDGSTQDLSGQVTWASSALAVATVSSTGNVSGVAAGMTTISAALSGVSGAVQLTVTPATLQSIAVTPSGASLAAGTTQQFVATGTFSDATTQDLTGQVTWASSSTAAATISTGGLATAVAAGSTTISAVRAGVTGSTTLQVTSATLSSLAVTPVGVTIANGTSLQFAATGTFSDGSTQDLTALATWTSSNTAVATLSTAAGSEGLARAISVGTSTITATRSGVSGGTVLTVSPAVLTAIAVTPSTPSIPNGSTQQFVATGIFSDNTTQNLTAQVAWSSSNTTAATISNAAGSEGLATALAVGSATISATSGGVSGATVLTVTNATLQSIAVTPPSASSTVGSTRQYTATGTYSDATTRDLTVQVTWASSNTTVATISNAAGSQGLASAVGVGTTNITAALSGVTGSATLNVGGAGSVTLQSIVVTPANATISTGSTRQFTATGNYSDGSTQNLTSQVNWASTNTGVATISNALVSKGLASAVAAGTTNITATFQAVTGQTGLTVSSATLSSIAVTPAAPALPAGYRLPFRATGTYSDGSTQDITNNVTWASVTTAVATISNAAGSKGLATGVAVGTSSISATLGAVSGSTVLTVNNATLTSIAVTPASFTLARFATRQLTATGTFSNSSTLDLTTQVTWSSSRMFVAQVSGGGLVTAFSSGDAVITAARGAVNGTSAVTVP